jgi:hypothetical protein
MEVDMSKEMFKMFEESPISRKIFRYFDKRIGQTVAPIGLVKALAIHSAGSSRPRLSLMHVARSREFKSVTMMFAKKMFSEDMYVYIGGEQTVHRLKKDYGEDLNKKAILVNDGNMLFSAMARHTKDRWLGGMACLLTERSFPYGDNVDSFRLHGKISLLINLATPAFNRNKSEIFNTTIGNRLWIAHSWLTEEHNFQCKRNMDSTKGLSSNVFITEHYNRTIRNVSEYDKELVRFAKRYGVYSVRSAPECLDIVTAIACENARINHRNYLCEDDMELLRSLEDYNIDPLVPEHHRIIQGLRDELSPSDICHILHKSPSYKTTISKVKRKATESGALDAKRVK